MRLLGHVTLALYKPHYQPMLKENVETITEIIKVG